MQNRVLSCDWGSSSFRLRLVDTNSREAIAEIVSGSGNAAIYKKWKEGPNTDRVLFYLRYLKEAVEKLSAESGISLDEMIILVSGMASSSVGIRELQYAEVPFSMDGHSAHTAWISGQPVLPNDILLISGLQNAGDVMRGEETQLVGLADLCDGPGKEEGLYILPGTHSKHVTVRHNRIVHFETYMTGEVFDILTRHSMLAHAVSAPVDNTVTNLDIEAFLAGVAKSFASQLLNGLFSVRINQLKDYLPGQQNYFYLSGLLIGTELRSIRKESRQRLYLCCGKNMQPFYQMALEYASLAGKTITIAPEIMDRSAAAGQIKILKYLEAKTT
ncbi:MAG: 2-dehydro-3-deoxygalactonokinase [Bacteroidota bacterium]